MNTPTITIHTGPEVHISTGQPLITEAMRASEASRASASDLRDEALKRVEEHADAHWKEAALDAVQEAATRFPTFIVDDVWPLIAPDARTHEGRAIGAVMLKAKKLCWIEPTDEFRLSATAAHHANPRRVWRSKISKAA